MKNVIIIEIDALMPSRLGLDKSTSYIAPTIHTLAKSSLNCTNTFSAGNPTEFALPGLFASSYLLDYGGYRNGISNNPITFAEVLKNNGYQTCSFLNVFRPIMDGYDRGFDQSYKTVDFQVLEKNLMNTANWYKEHFKNENSIISKEKCIEDMIDHYEEYLENVLLYCKNFDDYMKDSIIPKSSIFNNIDFKFIKKEILKDKKIFSRNKKNYIKNFLNLGELGITQISKKIVQTRYSFIKTTKLDLKVKFQLIINSFLMWKKSASFKSAKNLMGTLLYIIINGRKSFITRYESGEYTLKKFMNWVEKKYDKKNFFFTYIKLLDAHELNIYSHDIQSKNTTSDEIKNISNLFKNIRRDKNYVGNVLYDCAINYSDRVVKKLINFLEEKKLRNNTIIVITADHGGQYPNLPIRNNITHRVNNFFDELYKIPLIINCKEIKAQDYKGLVSSVDINSTLLDMLNIKIPPSFRGKSIINKDFKRDYVVFENQGRGPCDLENKPIRICVRSKLQKIIYEFKKYENKSGKVVGAFDLINDPEEYYNLSNNELFIKKCNPLIQIASKRINDIFYSKKS